MLKVKPGKRRTPEDLLPWLIAPCGMNCGLCMAYLREKNTCGGCRSGDEGKATSVLGCTIRNCGTIRNPEAVPAPTGTDGADGASAGDPSRSAFCSACTKLPCPRLKRLDARYRAKYRMSMLENLRAIRESGVEAFLEAERKRWACPSCGGLQCVHTAECMYCGFVWA